MALKVGRDPPNEAENTIAILDVREKVVPGGKFDAFARQVQVSELWNLRSLNLVYRSSIFIHRYLTTRS